MSAVWMAVRRLAQAIVDGADQSNASVVVGTDSISAAEVLKSASAAVEEIRRQIDHQVRAADTVDTKGAAVLTLTATVAGFAATRVQLDNDVRRVAGVITFVIVLAILGCCIQALKPRAGFSYGANATDLVALVDQYPHEQVMLALADSLRDARNVNVEHLEAKQGWYQNALRLIVAGIVAIAVMVAVEAIK